MSFIKNVTKSYVFLFIISFICVGHPWWQRIVVLGWMMYVARLCHEAKQDNVRLQRLIWRTVFTQFPGIILILVSLWAMRAGNLGEWPGGLMEVWYHPFVAWLEILPAGHLGIWSDMYLATCLMPLVIILLCGLSWLLPEMLTWPTRP